MVSSLSSIPISQTAQDWPITTPSTASNRSAGQGSATGPLANGPSDASSVPTFSKIEQLKGTDPTEFQQVVVNAISQLKAAAEQNPNPFASSYLWGLVNRFQFALDTAASNPEV